MCIKNTKKVYFMHTETPDLKCNVEFHYLFKYSVGCSNIEDATCQKSTSRLTVTWEQFVDEESGMSR